MYNFPIVLDLEIMKMLPLSQCLENWMVAEIYRDKYNAYLLKIKLYYIMRCRNAGSNCNTSLRG